MAWFDSSSLALPFWRSIGALLGGIRTLDALHLASVEHLHTLDQAIEVASFDRRLVAAARDLGFAIYGF